MRKVKYAEMGKRIKDARIALGLKQKDCLGPLGDVTAQMLSDWENGYVCPSLTYLINISKFYNISLDYIVLGKNKNSNKKKIVTYKDAMEMIVELEQSGLFDIGGYAANTCYVTNLSSQDKQIGIFKQNYDNLLTGLKTMKKELFTEALKDLLNEFDFPLSKKE